MKVSAQLSLYPLETCEINDAVMKGSSALDNFDVIVDVGSMSTVIIGEMNEVMLAITKLFENVAVKHKTVLNITLSNSCGCSS
ncbi:MAG: YkoF family thiamine/hydroxymethylpyrimidine-binding protein [Caldisericia bacterium]